MANSAHSTQIVQTPYYAAYQYSGGAVGIIFEPRTTDAAPHRRPPATTRQPDTHGEVNYFEDATADTSLSWRKKLGEMLARQVVRKDVQKQGDKWTANAETSLVLDFPEGYKLYTHFTGDHYAPRTDTYLYGSRFVGQFRSPNEFAKHAIWLMKGGPLNSNGEPDCECKYCDPSRTQEEISSELLMRNPHTRDRRGRDKDEDDEGRERAKRPKKTPAVAFIPAKDYTKLNPNTTS